jgi:hypothetical protein
MGSFWGEPTCQPNDKDVVRLVEYLRKQSEHSTRERTLQTATSAMRAIVAYVTEEHGPREAMAIIDKVRGDVAGLE